MTMNARLREFYLIYIKFLYVFVGVSWVLYDNKFINHAVTFLLLIGFLCGIWWFKNLNKKIFEIRCLILLDAIFALFKMAYALIVR